MSARPEHVAPPEIFYNEAEAKKYARNTRMMEIQVRWLAPHVCDAKPTHHRLARDTALDAHEPRCTWCRTAS
jgi:hypothetical protein